MHEDNERPKIEITSEELLSLLDEVKEVVREEIRNEIAEEYAKRPTYRGILGGISWVWGLMPDSSGRPSGSWTLYVLSHSIPLIVVGAWAYAVIMGISMKGVVMLSPIVVLTPMILSWLAWLAHHKKLVASMKELLGAVSQAFAAFKGRLTGSIGSMVGSAVSAAGAEAKKPDPTLKPGVKVDVKKRPKDQPPKTDPNSFEVPPS